CRRRGGGRSGGAAAHRDDAPRRRRQRGRSAARPPAVARHRGGNARAAPRLAGGTGLEARVLREAGVTLRYAVGIDLGTSNSALAYADLLEGDPQLHVFDVPQLVDASLTQGRKLLPSHLYLPSPHEGLGEAVVGTFARDRGAQVPGRHVASAKSWLCHPAVDRTAPILPWGAPPDVPRLSPVAASARILRHLRDAWDRAHADAPLAEQDVIVTVPASFDEGARALTLRATEEAGLPEILLLEEPQAAFYDWTRVHRGRLGPELADIHLVLVVDVGGGTTDLTLIRTEVRDEAPPLLERIAVGDHLLLGGDNMDIALARTAEKRIGQRLNAAQFGALVQASRAAKELLLGEGAPERTSVAVAGAGRAAHRGALELELEARAPPAQRRPGSGGCARGSDVCARPPRPRTAHRRRQPPHVLRRRGRPRPGRLRGSAGSAGRGRTDARPRLLTGARAPGPVPPVRVGRIPSRARRRSGGGGGRARRVAAGA